jgi:hypothetical protein
LVQTKATISTTAASGHPTIAQIHQSLEDEDHQAWGAGKGNFVSSHNANDKELVQTKATISTTAASGHPTIAQTHQSLED